jgi:hypothetical protein
VLSDGKVSATLRILYFVALGGVGASQTWTVAYWFGQSDWPRSTLASCLLAVVLLRWLRLFWRTPTNLDFFVVFFVPLAQLFTGI